MDQQSTEHKKRFLTMPDFLALAGVIMLGVGLWLFSPPLSLSVIGTLSLTAGIIGQRSENGVDR